MSEGDVEAVLAKWLPASGLADNAIREYLVGITQLSASELCEEPMTTNETVMLLRDQLSSLGADDGDLDTVVDSILELVRAKVKSATAARHVLYGEREMTSDGQVRLRTAITIDEQIELMVPETSKTHLKTYYRQQESGVDSKKLAKANAKMMEKLERRIGDRDKVQVDIPATQISVSQAVDRRSAASNTAALGDAESGSTQDIKMWSVDMSVGSKKLLDSCDIMFGYGRRYGFVGRNGMGKTTLLSSIGTGQLTIGGGVSVLHVEQEVSGDDTSVLESVLEADTKRCNLIAREAELNETLKIGGTDEEMAKAGEHLKLVYQQMQDHEVDKAPAKAAAILCGLGFQSEEQTAPTRVFSGGWRMRVALARALFAKPDLLLLDEPTNMLDLKAVYWLQNHLQTWSTTLVCVSHDRTFLNRISTDMLHLHSKRIDAYKGNYDSFAKTCVERLALQTREYEAAVKERAHIQEFIDKFRFNAKRASLVQSRIKYINKLPPLKPVEREEGIKFTFTENIDVLSPPVILLDSVSFRYNKDAQNIFTNIDANVDCTSRVGDNGAGKTTLLKLLRGTLEATGGRLELNRRVRVGYFAQHHVDALGDLRQTALQTIKAKFKGRTEDVYRSQLARFGVDATLASQPLYTLSGGQKSRLAFALVAGDNPNLLILDEPTNHLDVDSVEALGEALNKFPGGVVLVSHDERLIELVCKELWVVADHGVRRLEGGLKEYQALVYKQIKDLL